MVADRKAAAVCLSLEYRVLYKIKKIGKEIEPLVLQNDKLRIKKHDNIAQGEADVGGGTGKA